MSGTVKVFTSCLHAGRQHFAITSRLKGRYSLLKALNENGQNLLRKGQQKDCECVKDSAKKETIDPGVVTFQWLIVLAARVLRAEKVSLNAPFRG